MVQILFRDAPRPFLGVMIDTVLHDARRNGGRFRGLSRRVGALGELNVRLWDDFVFRHGELAASLING